MAPLDDDYVVLSTIHSAKGQEWKIVHILNEVDGCIPSERATGACEEIEEEHRPPYVAMTRAKDELNLVVPHRLFTYRQAKFGGGHVCASVSRFIPKSIEGFFERRNWSELGAVSKCYNEAVGCEGRCCGWPQAEVGMTSRAIADRLTAEFAGVSAEFNRV
jgi:UvrD-like helicase C-terminal domain